MRGFVAVSLAALLAPQSASAKPLPPATKWVVDFGDSHCVAQRIYSAGKNPVYLLLKASAVGEGLQVSVAVKGPNGYGVQEKAKLSFGGQEPTAVSQIRFGAEKKQVRMINLSKPEVARLAGATELRWDTANMDYTLPLGPMKDLVKIIEECRVSLGEYWNGTPEKLASLKQEPRLNTAVRKLFKSTDYPSQALMGDQSGTARIVALVDEKGQMTDCTIVETSGVAVLDAQTCIIVRERGKFSPALGADGQPVKGVFSQRIRWETE